MTLRVRLLLLLVGIVAAGLVISDVVTYNALSSFLTTRVDQQLEGAAFPVGRALLSTSGLGPEVPLAPRNVPVFPAHGQVGAQVGGLHFPSSFRNGGGIFRSSAGETRNELVPPGTYGVLRSASGKVEAHLFFVYGGKEPSAPQIPAALPGSGLPAGKDAYFTANSSGPSSSAYRALAKPLSGTDGVVVVAIPLNDVDSTLRQLLLVELIVSAALLTGLAVLSYVMVRRDLRPLDAMTEAAGAIARGDLSQRVAPAPEGTEVGQLGTAFNTMLDEIEVAFAQRAASEARLRRFLADASHEMRTPLTSILGYSELFELGVRDRPEDLARSLRHIRDEASRMETLVDDLLALAQLDHERPLRVEPVDLASLLRRSVASIEASRPERHIGLDLAGPRVVDGDDQRLRQVVDNLLVNAVTHTPEEAGIGVCLSGEDGWAVIAVHDDGPGIPPDDLPRIFDPFFRSDPSRSRHSGGSGLGLAIVAAVVAAHHGQVRVVPGERQGVTFEVRLPVHQSEEGLPGSREPSAGGRLDDSPGSADADELGRDHHVDVAGGRVRGR